jgi:hypothetical protein
VTRSGKVRRDENYRDFLTKAIQLAEVRMRFEVYTGPVKDTGGVKYGVR